MKVGLCICVKDESDINEFIAHYITLGFDKVFIYDNMSSPKIINILNKNLKQYVNIKDDLVTIPNQHNCYTECLNQNKDYDWLFFCDADEFLYLKNIDNIKDYLKNVPEIYSAVFINWLCFGTSNIEKLNKNKLIMEQLLYRESYDYKLN